jgi:hypothetical protein
MCGIAGVWASMRLVGGVDDALLAHRGPKPEPRAEDISVETEELV